MNSKRTVLPDRLLTRWLSGAADEKEREAVAAWAGESPEREQELFEMKKVYLASFVRSGNADAADPRRRRSRIRRILIGTLSAAAASALLVGIGYMTASGIHPQPMLSALSIAAPQGQTAATVLSDSTSVWLNSNSELVVVSDGVKGERTVSLKGEAFFDVAKDAQHPFVVNCGGRSIRVLGTSFNVSSYSPEHFSLDLLSGKVEMTDENGFTCTLSPMERLEFNDGKYSKTHIDSTDKRGWMDGFYHFNDISLKDIIRSMGNYYNVTIGFADPSLADLRCSCTFRKEDSLGHILSVICKAYHGELNYRISSDGSSAVIFRKK